MTETQIYTAPQIIDAPGKNSIFIGGTIDNGDSEDWQADTALLLAQKGYTVFNPRRSDWNPDVKQSAEDPFLFQQIAWESNAMERAKFIILNFLPKSVSAITIAELAEYAKSGKCYVCCPTEFWRAGNVEFLCMKYNVPLYRTMFELILNEFN